MDKKDEKPLVPNKFLFDNFTNSIAIFNFLVLSEILKDTGRIDDKKEWRTNVVNEWLENMKNYLNSNVGLYSRSEKKLRKLNKLRGGKQEITSTEEMQRQASKSLIDFKAFLNEIIINRELDNKNE